jgi:neurotransmitter:Na+ symporter, NSS family
MAATRGQWSSKLGFILAAAGSAIGLGNIWRFSYIVGENGGGAFVLLYVFFIIVLGLPYLLAEFALGRNKEKNAFSAMKELAPKTPWKYVGLFGIITACGILSFYGVVAGWTVGYIYKMAANDIGNFGAYVSDPVTVLLLFAGFMILTAGIVYGGVEKGIEKWSKILMPLLLIILIGLIIYANTLEGSFEGLKFYLMPDFTKITDNTIMSAMGQAFFSLSLGLGLMVTYGSYLGKKENIISSSIYIASFDTLIALLSGLIIFPALFAMGADPESGPTLVFIVLPKLFANMPAGLVIGAFFFLLLSVAALTSTISLLEVPVAFLVDEYKFNRKTTVWYAAFAVFLVGIPSALSQGASDFFSKFDLIPIEFAQPDFLSQISFFFGDFALAFGALWFSIFVGWVWGARNASNELLIGAPGFKKWQRPWEIFIKYIIPIVIFMILINIFYEL